MLGARSAFPQRLLSIELTGDKMCAVREGAGLYCANPSWQWKASDFSWDDYDTDYVDVAVTSYAVAAIRADGTGDGWALEHLGEGSHDWMIPSSRHHWTQIDGGGGDAICGVTDELGLFCWGQSEFARVSLPSGAYTAVSVGTQHACALRVGGKAMCWGMTWSDGPEYWHAPDLRFSQVSAGQGYSCGVTGAGRLACWGPHAGEYPPPDGDGWVEVGVGAYLACAIGSDGQMVCWGEVDGEPVIEHL